MLLGISLEVHVPGHVDRDALRRIGTASAPAGADPDMDDAEAVEYAFRDADAITALTALGVVWAAARTGPVIPDGL